MKDEHLKMDYEPSIIAIASCHATSMYNPFNTNQEIDKNDFGHIIIIFDIITIFAIIIFVKVLEVTQKEYVDHFDEATLEMTDFTIRVDNLPHHKFYGDNDDALRAIITSHFQ